MTAVIIGASVVLAGFAAAAALHPTRVRRVRTDAPTHPARSAGSRKHPTLSLHRSPSTVTPAALGGWADELARSLRHGTTLRAGLLTVLPNDDVLHEHSASLRHRLERGADVAAACDGWADEINAGNADSSPLLAAFATMVGAAAHLGGSVSTPLERFAVVMRQRVADELERNAQSAQAKLSARVLTMVPLAVLALLLLTDAEVRTVVAEPAGATVIIVGLAVNAIGGWWMRRIVGPSALGGR